MTTGSMTNMPMVRAPVRASTISQQSTADAQITEVNSYILPSGSRFAANPLARMEITLASRPTLVTTTAARPNRSPHGTAARGGRAPIRPMSPVSCPVPPTRVSVEVPPPCAIDPDAVTSSC
jgi:hypothetical protein